MRIENYRGEIITLEHETNEHIKLFHPEVTTTIIKKVLHSPNEVRKSISHSTSELYYIYKAKSRFYCVVVKKCEDGNYVSTALTTSKIKKGKVIYKSGEQ